eukprot:2183441-Pleurochrysis_carterae.AAC.6
MRRRALGATIARRRAHPAAPCRPINVYSRANGRRSEQFITTPRRSRTAPEQSAAARRAPHAPQHRRANAQRPHRHRGVWRESAWAVSIPCVTIVGAF